MHASVQLGGSALPRIETHSRLSGEDVSVFSVSRHSITPLGRSRDSAASRDVRAPSRQLESPGFLPNLNDQSEHNVWFSGARRTLPSSTSLRSASMPVCVCVRILIPLRQRWGWRQMRVVSEFPVQRLSAKTVLCSDSSVGLDRAEKWCEAVSASQASTP